MSDLTDRLRLQSHIDRDFRLGDEAADTIDRLTAERDMWKDTLAQRDRELANARAVDVHSCHAGCTRAGCVNARLRDELAGVVQTLATHANQLQNYAGNLETMLNRKTTP